MIHLSVKSAYRTSALAINFSARVPEKSNSKLMGNCLRFCCL